MKIIVKYNETLSSDRDVTFSQLDDFFYKYRTR